MRGIDIFFKALLYQVSSTDIPEAPATMPGDYFTVVPNVDVDADTVGITGLGYNTNTNEYIVSYYSYDKAAQLWFYHRNSDNLLAYSASGTLTPTPDRIIDVFDYLDHIQGNTYDSVSDSYWVLGSQKGLLADNRRVLINIDLEGNLIESYNMNSFSFQAGMVVHNPVTDTLLIKGNNKTAIWEINKTTKAIIRTLTAHTIYEGLGLDIDRQIIWVAGDEGTIKAHAWSDFSVLWTGTFDTLNDGSKENIEQILVDPVDGRICIGFDAYLHGGNNNGNAIFKYDFGDNIEL